MNNAEEDTTQLQESLEWANQVFGYAGLCMAVGFFLAAGIMTAKKRRHGSEEPLSQKTMILTYCGVGLLCVIVAAFSFLAS